jgi:hypothetical protein
MSFLQPMLLAALPLVALPIIIHLINQRRYQTVKWAAMMFLLAANRMSRGYARLRQWLIMAVRMAAIAGLIFAVSRPLRHDHCACRSLAQHAASRGKRARVQARDWPATDGRHARDTELGALDLDRQQLQHTARARIDCRPVDRSQCVPVKRFGRSAGDVARRS